MWAGGQGLATGTPAVSLTSSPAGTTSTVALDVESGGDVLVNGDFLVGHDVVADGNVTLASGSLSVVGGVRVPAGDSVSAGVTTGGGVTNGPVQVAPPCDCSNPLDVLSIIAAHKTANDDAAIGLTVSGLDTPASPVTLPCGQYYVDGIHGGAVELDVTGRAALFVDGDLNVNQGFKIVLAPGTELDLFVAGNVELQGATSLGDVDAPARMRLYVGGGTFTLSANATVGANVYAPSADVQLASNFEMWGARLRAVAPVLGQLHDPLRHLGAPDAGVPSAGDPVQDVRRLLRRDPRVQGRRVHRVRLHRRLLRAARVRHRHGAVPVAHRMSVYCCAPAGPASMRPWRSLQESRPRP